MIVIEQSLIYLPLVFGAYISFSLLKISDLSLETAYLIGAFVGMTSLSHFGDYPLWVGLMITIFSAMFGGMLVGCISSCITVYGKIPHLLSAIITYGLFHGIFQLCSPPYQSLILYDNVLMLLPVSLQFPEIGALAIVCLIITGICMNLLSTQLGHCFTIFGYNPYFFRHFNISTSYVFITGVMIANGLAGISGFLFAQTSNLVELNMGIGKSLFCITVLILGRSVISNKKSTVLSPMIGVVSYFVLQQFLLKIGFNLKYFTMIQSFLVLLIILFIYKKDRNQYDQLGV